jgi:hypothetical protein
MVEPAMGNGEWLKRRGRRLRGGWEQRERFDDSPFPIPAAGRTAAHGQNSALPGARGYGIASRMLASPHTYTTRRSKPSPKPPCGTVP